MVRTQIYLKEKEYRAAKVKSRRDDTTLSESIRRLIRLGLEKEREEAETHSKKGDHRITQLLRSVRLLERGRATGPADTSLAIDQVLYGKT